MFTRLAASEGYPDGSTVYADGGFYNDNAQWDGGRIVRYDNTGAGSARIGLPPALPTCLAFGGPGLESLSVTAASIGLSYESLNDQPRVGRVFALSGLPERLFAADVRA